MTMFKSGKYSVCYYCFMKLTKQYLAEIGYKRLPRKIKKHFKNTMSVFEDFFVVIKALNVSKWNGKIHFDKDI